MVAVDTSVLVFAHREETPQHERARTWLYHLAESPDPWAIPVFSLAEFVRVVTHPRVFDPPSSLHQAVGALDSLLASPSVRVLLPGAGFWSLLRDCLSLADARGNLAFDAQIVAVCREHGIDRLLTEDRDFHRFPHLEVVNLTSDWA